MLSVADALEKLLAALPVVETERVALSSTADRVLGEDVIAAFDSPRFANSSMDGFAVRSADILSASEEKPKSLLVTGDIPAGKSTSATLQPGQAMRIMTGAAMPSGADAVVPVEDTDAAVAQPGAPLPAVVQVRRVVDAGEFVRPAGQDFAAGQALMKSGTRLRPQDLALLAMLGITEVSLFRKPRVAIFSSGDELLQGGEVLLPGKIYETNSYALKALVESAGAESVVLGVAKDTFDDVKAYLQRAVAEKADLILSSAGVSVGAFDYLREAVLSDGELDFWKVNMRPGRPFTFGRYRKIGYIGLPGNPASAFVGFEVFVRAALQKVGGVKDWSRPNLKARLAESIESDGRESYLRVQLRNGISGWDAYLTGHQGSGNLYSLVQADALMRVPAGVKNLEADAQVDVWLL